MGSRLTHDDDADLRGRVRRLLEFLRELVGSQDKPVRQYGSASRVEWLYVPGRALAVDHSAVAGDAVIRVKRVSVRERPDVPPSIRSWIEGADTDRPRVRNGAPRDDRVRGEAWLELWGDWKRADARTRPAAQLFRSVDVMRDELLNQPEVLELVVASGFLSTSVGGVDVGVHLITQSAAVERDEATGDLLVRITAGSVPRLEDLQILSGLDGFDSSHSLEFQDRLVESVASAVSADVMTTLDDWVHASLSAPTVTSIDVNRPVSKMANSITFAPALLLRKRTEFAITNYYDAMIAAIDSDAPVPLGLAQLVESVDSTLRMDFLNAHDFATVSAEPLFPLPVNSAQASILSKLAIDTGVVVEGPPGTGKTHTIANLMSALMAQGQRVLVTSQKSQALQVLREMLPAEIQDLCVSITDLSQGGARELDHSTSIIADRKADFDEAATATRIRTLSGSRNIVLNRRYKLTDQMRAARQAEVEQHAPAAGYRGTLAGIITQLDTERTLIGWVPGPIDGAEPPLSTDEFNELVGLLELRSHHLTERTGQHLPSLGATLPGADEVRELCRLARSDRQTHPLAAVESDVFQDISHSVSALNQASKTVSNSGEQYVALADALLAGERTRMLASAREVDALIELAASADGVVGRHTVTVEITGRQALDAFDAWARLLESQPRDRRRRIRAPQQQRDVDSLGAGATVDGVPAITAPHVRVVTEYLRARCAVEDAAALLVDLGIDIAVDSGSLRHRVDVVDSAWAKIRSVELLMSLRHRVEQDIASVTELPNPLMTVQDCAELLGWVQGATTGATPEDARQRLNEFAVRIAGGHPECDELAAVTDALRSADTRAFGASIDPYLDAEREQHEQLRAQQLLGRLSVSAPGLAAVVVEDNESDWAAATADFSDAWRWRWVQQWVADQQTPLEPDRLNFELDVIERELSGLTAALAAESAWQKCLRRMSTAEMQALRAYQDNMSRAGTGTGPVSQRYRIAARSAMREAQTAVPAWIMPIKQVLASIPPHQNAFDVVIVDEASQADITSLFLLWLAPRVIVVGDEKQCAPDAVNNFTLKSVFAKQDTYLYDVPVHVRNTLTPRSSLFSMLRNRFGQVVRLREHYRSMPEIIEWSSAQFYGHTPLVPVRQFGADRLPPLRSTHVKNASTSGSGTGLINEAEARALVDQLCACLADAQYDGMSFGVAVLQSSKQANFIRKLLFARVPAEQRESRRLRVGTPPEFQGDERDVMFISMVVAPSTSFNAFTTAMYQRRFNVAASRARNQLWLFHSVVESELSTGDLRRSLLSYIESAPAVPVPPMPTDVIATSLHPEFASILDQAVFIALRDRGYHVNPQVTVNELTIDLVLTGVAAKVAVQCDDDNFFDSDGAKATIDRELELRRAGWNFYRVSASDFALDAGRVMKSLIELLDAVGIMPDDVHVVVGDHASGAAWSPVELRDDDPGMEAAEEDEDAVTQDPSVSEPAVITPLPVTIETPDLEPEPSEVAVVVSADVIASSIRYALNRNQFTVEKTAEDLGVTTEQVRESLAQIRAADLALRTPKPVRVRPSPRIMPRKTTVAVKPVAIEPAAQSLTAALQAQLAALPAASWATARELAVAAAVPAAPLTLERCMTLTGMSSARADQLLADLVASKNLLERRRGGAVDWIRIDGGTR